MARADSVISHLDMAQQVLERVRAEAGPGADAEVTIEDITFGLTRFANSFIHQSVEDTSALVRLRLHLDGRTASGSTTVGDEPGLAALVSRTVAAARLCPPDPQWPGVAGPAPMTVASEADRTIAEATPADRAARVRAFVDAAAGLKTAGYCSTMLWTLTFANSAGQVAEATTADAAVDGIARDRGADGAARRSSRRLSDLDGAVLGARAAAKARAGVDPVELPPGRYEVVLEPTAVLDLVKNMGVFGFNGKAVHERRSFVELGQAQLDPTITFVDDPVAADAAALPFDFEGTPRRRLTVVDRGVCVALPHDRRSAARAGTASTGHAVPGGAVWGAFAPNLALLASANGASANGGSAGDSSANGGSATPGEVDGPAADAAVADLVAGVGRGLLVTDNWYTRVLDPRTLVLTGLTRNGVWLIENGEVTRPVQNLRFTQSYPLALAPGAVLAVGSHAVPVPFGWGSMRAPALRLATWNFTGNASG